MPFSPANASRSPILIWLGQVVATRRRRRTETELSALSPYLQRDLGFLDRGFPWR